ncbi:hypothetical protein [Flavobacterium dankookense]|uniref:Uncharacterized protein n=1 Tax=Flavobacterium dankookense TaxID=706186 RepID=A0A4R6QEX6_9FLAO|nr:hypothetical protein [Flavobacterium dankookense]TDP60807.1 hypothetical protein BC748_0407 [Flavobacterium dankookense]
MNNNYLTIKFGGDGNIKVDTLTEFLEIYKELIYSVNNQLGYFVDDLIIEVSPPENGSFKIKISPKYEKMLLKSFETIVVSTLAGLLLYYLTKPKEDNTLKEIKSLLEKQNVEPEIINNVYNFYQNTGAEQKIKQSFIIVNEDENITDLKIDKNDKEIINIPKSQFANLINREEQIEIENEPKKDIIRDEALLIVKTIHFEGNAKWVFIFRGYPIKASIKDPNFIIKLNNEAFRKGDTFKVILARNRTYDEDLQTYIVDQNSYVIEQVFEHISKTDNQNKLDLK